MSFVQWSDTLSTGVAEIDEQHKKLVTMLNELAEADTAKGDPDAAFRIVENMKAYALMHFSTEERYMNAHKYPGTLDHLAEHASFVSKVKVLEARSGSDPNFIALVVKFLKQWLIEHISNVDIKMGRYLQQHA